MQQKLKKGEVAKMLLDSNSHPNPYVQRFLVFLGWKKFATKGLTVTTETSSAFGGFSPECKVFKAFSLGLAQRRLRKG